MNCEDCMYFNQNDNYPGHLGWCDVDLPNWIYEAMTIDITKITPEKLAEMNNSLMVDNNHLRQQLAAALAAIKVKDAVLGDIVECIGAGRLRVASAEAIAATADLDGLILCHAEPCRDDGRCQYAIDHGAEGLGHCPEGKCCMQLYRAWEPKP